MSFSSSFYYIRLASKLGTLRLQTRVGQFGEFVAIMDDRGTIEVADNIADAEAVVACALGTEAARVA